MPGSPGVLFTHRYVVMGCAILCTLLWGSSYPAVKTGYALLDITRDDTPAQLLFAGYRFFLAGIFLLALTIVSGKRWWFTSAREWVETGVLGVAQTTLQYLFFYIGLAHTTGVKASILNATGIFFSVLLAHFLYRNDRLNRRKVLGCLLGFIGVIIVNASPGVAGVDFSFTGDGFIVIASFILAAASLYGKHLSQHRDAVLMTAWQLTLGGAVLVVIGWLMGGELPRLEGASLALLMYLALLSSTAFALWGVLLKYNPVGMIAVFQFMVPVFGAVLSALFLSESLLAWRYPIALILVCGGILIVTRMPRTPDAR